MTEKLYYLDSHISEFDAVVISCTEAKHGYAVELDRTAFFPEGGGQLADTGFIASCRVTDVHEKGGVFHYTDTPIDVGERVHCVIDYEQRRRRMQNHSGEHIVSGLIHKNYGFENVGFHMGEDCMTIDLSGELTWEELCSIERKANEVVRENIPIRTWFPDNEELSKLEYRSKLELTENVRIVEIEGVDRCACCAPHVHATGEVGIIKLLDCQRHRGGVRVSLICGMDALDDYIARQNSVTAISQALSVKRSDVSDGVERLLEENRRLKERGDLIAMKLVGLYAEDTQPTESSIVVFDDVLDETAQRELVNLLVEKTPVIAAVFCGEDSKGWRYIIGSRTLDLRKNTRLIDSLIDGRGGGSSQMIQGRASADRDSILRNISNFSIN